MVASLHFKALADLRASELKSLALERGFAATKQGLESELAEYKRRLEEPVPLNAY